VLEQTVPDIPTEPRKVRPGGSWAVGTSDGDDFAVSRRYRHQLADLSKATVDTDGCLVCPWHSSRYDVRTGAMVDGPQGFLSTAGAPPATARSCWPTQTLEAARRPGAPGGADHGSEDPVGEVLWRTSRPGCRSTRGWAEPGAWSSSPSPRWPAYGPVARCTPAARCCTRR
jgi:nitrite reductase/ring-hydroxylating ferredoxin subunit